MSLPEAALTAVTQERIASPFLWTVHAPQSEMPAAELCSRQSEDVTQIPQQGHIGITIETAVHSVYFELNHSLLLPVFGSTLRAT